MTPIIQYAVVQALAWTLIHFLWQGAAIALIAFAILRGSQLTASSRYVVGVIALGAMLAAPVATFARLAAVPTLARGAEVGLAVAPAKTEPLSQVPTAADLSGTTRSIVPTAAPLAVLGIWCTGVSVLSLRLLGGWLVARRLTRRSIQPATPEIDALVRRLSGRLGLDRIVRVVESSAVAVPVMIGWMRPVVLLPAAALSGLSIAQVEAVLAHELAHVRRHDYLVNLLQSAVETLLFYHPAVWWISRQVRTDREHCCDDIAVGVCDRVVYATALTSLAGMMASPHVALGATDGSLLSRVRRILGESRDTPRAALGWAPAVGVLCMAGAFVPAGFGPVLAQVQTKAATRPAAVVIEQATPRVVEIPTTTPLESATVTEIPVRDLTSPDPQVQTDVQAQLDTAKRELQDARQRVETGAGSREELAKAELKLGILARHLADLRGIADDNLQRDLELKMKAQIDDADRELRRTQSLFEKGLVTRDALAQAEMDFERKQLERLAELDPQTAQPQLDQLKREQVERMLVRARALFDKGLVTREELARAEAAQAEAAETEAERARARAKLQERLVKQDAVARDLDAMRAAEQANWVYKLRAERSLQDLTPLSPQASALRDRVAVDNGAMTNDALTSVLKDAAKLDVDADRAGVLIAIAQRQALTPEMVTLYAAAAKGLRSDADRARVFAQPIRLKQVR